MVVTSVSFKKIELATGPAEDGSWKTKLHFAVPFIKYLVSLIGMMLVLLLVLRPLIKFVLAESTKNEIGIRQLPATAGGPGNLAGKGLSLELEEPENQVLREIDVVRKMADQDAKKFAELLRNWLK